MYTPLNNTLASSITTATFVDVSVHNILGLSWKILLPYTVFCVGLMIYSQSRLIRGQYNLAKIEKNQTNK